MSGSLPAGEKPWNTADVASHLGLPKRTVLAKFEAYMRGDQDGIPGFNLGGKGGPVRYYPSEIEKWMRGERPADGGRLQLIRAVR
jgi:hypothetical protein